MGVPGAVRRGNAHQVQHAGDIIFSPAGIEAAVDKSLLEAVLNIHLGVESAVGVLKDDLHVPAERAQFSSL